MNIISKHVIINELNKVKLPLKLDLQFFAATMRVQDAMNGASGECFVTIQDRRYNFAQVLNVQADMEKQKTEVPILGRMQRGNKANGVTNSGSATFHFNTSIFREILYHYKETGEDIYFDMQLTNEDKTASVGRQTIILKDCNLDGGIVALIDVEADYLEDEFSFTFEDWEMPEKFSVLKEME